MLSIRSLITTLIELAAVALILLGTALICPPAVFIVAGVILGAISWRLTSDDETEAP